MIFLGFMTVVTGNPHAPTQEKGLSRPLIPRFSLTPTGNRIGHNGPYQLRISHW
jgi:hypothetical protein